MSYETAPFVKPIKNANRDMSGHEKRLLDNFRYERSRSPMAEVVRQYLENKNEQA